MASEWKPRLLVLEHRPVVICQCVVACHHPFKEEGSDEWSPVGCLRYRGHTGDHGLEDTEPKPTNIGPRVTLREHRDLDGKAPSYYEGRCWNCTATYRMTAETAL